MSAARVLTNRELNRALLARQLLLRRHQLHVTQAVERVGALQAQWPPSPYVALWSRLDGFRRDDLLRAVEKRRVVKATPMPLRHRWAQAADRWGGGREIPASSRYPIVSDLLLRTSCWAKVFVEASPLCRYATTVALTSV